MGNTAGSNHVFFFKNWYMIWDGQPVYNLTRRYTVKTMMHQWTWGQWLWQLLHAQIMHHVAFGCVVVSPCAQNVSHLLRSWSQGMIVLAEAFGWIQVEAVLINLPGICESWVSLSDPQPHFSHVLPVLPKMLFTFSPEVQSLPPFKIKFV